MNDDDDDDDISLISAIVKKLEKQGSMIIMFVSKTKV